MCKPNVPPARTVDATPPNLESSASPPQTFQMAQPTATGAIENSDLFRDWASRAWGEIDNGRQHAETAFSYGRDGMVTDLGKSPDEAGRGHMRLRVPGDSFAILHTHNNNVGARPSPQDIDSAKTSGTPIYVMSRDGLYMVRPSDGEVLPVFNNFDWTKVAQRGPQYADARKARALQKKLEVVGHEHQP